MHYYLLIILLTEISYYYYYYYFVFFAFRGPTVPKAAAATNQHRKSDYEKRQELILGAFGSQDVQDDLDD